MQIASWGSGQTTRKTSPRNNTYSEQWRSQAGWERLPAPRKKNIHHIMSYQTHVMSNSKSSRADGCQFFLTTNPRNIKITPSKCKYRELRRQASGNTATTIDRRQALQRTCSLHASTSRRQIGKQHSREGILFLTSW